MSGDNKIIEFETRKREAQLKTRIGRKTVFVKIAMVIALFSLAVLGFFSLVPYKTYTVVKTIQSDIPKNNVVDFASGCLIYDNEGIKYENKKGTIVWNKTYLIKSPKAVVCGKYVAVADIRGNTAEVFSANDGSSYTIDTEQTITDVKEITNSGHMILFMEDDTSSYIAIYKKNEKIWTIKTALEKEGYPISATISDNGLKLAVSYLYMSDLSIENTIKFYYLGSEGDSAVDKVVGMVTSSDSAIYPYIHFIDEENGCAFGDDRLQFFQMNKRVDVGKEVRFDSEIKTVFTEKKYVGVVVQAKPSEKNTLNVMYIFNKKGRLIKKVSMNYVCNSVIAEKNAIYVLGDRACGIYSNRGRLKMEYQFEEEVMDISKAGINKYALVFKNRTQIIRLKF